MEKTRKKILGFLCLAATIAITVVAACLPTAQSSAVGGANTNITLRVLGPIADVTITESPESIIESTIPIVIDPNQTIVFTHEHVDPVIAVIAYLPFGIPDGTDYTYTEVYHELTDYQPGSVTTILNLDDYGYGHFIFTVTGDGDSGYDEDSVAFDYSALVIDAEQEVPGENPTTDLYYDDEVVDYIIVTILDENGNEIPGVDPIRVPSGVHEIELPFIENDLPSGNYIIKADPYDEDGNIVPNIAVDDLLYIAPDLEVPNTGGPLGMLNLSRTDYIATGVIIFFSGAIFAIIMLKKQRKDNKKR